MKFNLEINLDDEAEVQDFIDKHGTTMGRELADQLGLKGKNSSKLATLLSCYARNKQTAIALRRDGAIRVAMSYEAICDRIYPQIQSLAKCWEQSW